MPSLPRPSWKLLFALLMLSAVPVVAGLARLSGLAAGGDPTPENARFLAAPTPVVLHVVSASLFCVLGAFQFDGSLRQRVPQLHRLAGRAAASGGLVAALTGVWMASTYDIPGDLQGPLLYGVRIGVGFAMALALGVAVQAALRRRIHQHSAWMVRAYALGQGAGTQVLILLPVTVVAGAPTLLFRDVLMSAAWGLNLAIAEWVIRRWLPST
jgi:uncharacterized membrane protein